MLIIYCPACGTPTETEEYDSKTRLCLNCRAVWTLLDKPKLAWILENMDKDG